MAAARAGMAVRIRWRLIVPTILFMLLSSVDRVNVSFAALQMNVDLGFSPAEYGFGAGVLFVGFLAGNIPASCFCNGSGSTAGWRDARCCGGHRPARWP